MNLKCPKCGGTRFTWEEDYSDPRRNMLICRFLCVCGVKAEAGINHREGGLKWIKYYLTEKESPSK